jgi:hypothetical protein
VVSRSGTLVAPVGNFLEAFTAGLFEQPNAVPSMLEFMNVSPDFRPPRLVMDGSFATTGAASMEFSSLAWNRRNGTGRPGQFDENAADFFDVVLAVDDVLVAQKVAKPKALGLRLSLGASMKRAVFSPQGLGRIAGHPESFFVGHPTSDFESAGREMHGYPETAVVLRAIGMPRQSAQTLVLPAVCELS